MDNNILVWQAVIFGPDDTPWEGGTFKLLLEFTEDYPNKAPDVRFLTHMFHPNIYNDGKICLGKKLANYSFELSLDSLSCRHIAKPMEPDLRHIRHSHIHPIPAVRPKPCLACKR